MATHSSVLAWRIPGTGEPGRLSSMGSHRVGHDSSDLAVAAAAEKNRGDIPGGPVVKTSPSDIGGMGSILGQGTKIPRASQRKRHKPIKWKQCATNSIKT